MKVKSFTGFIIIILFIGVAVFLTRPPPATPQTPLLDAKAGEIYVANEGDRTISVIDAASLTVIDTIRLDGFPHNVNTDPLRKYVFATNHEGEEDESDEDEHMGDGKKHYLRIIDAKTHELIHSVEMNEMAAHVVPSRDGKKVFVSLEGGNKIVLVDLAIQEIIKQWTVGEGPHGFVLSNDGSKLYIPNMRTHDVSILDLAQEKETRLPIVFESARCETPVAMGITTDDRYVFVTCGKSFDAYKIDAQSQKVVGRVIFTKGEFPGPIQTPVHPENKYLYIPDMRNGVVHKIDIASFIVIKDIPTGKGAHGIAFANDGKRAYVTNTWENTVSVLDLESESVIKTIPVGVKPNGIAVSNGKNQGW